jgi:hypothetical protein
MFFIEYIELIGYNIICLTSRVDEAIVIGGIHAGAFVGTRLDNSPGCCKCDEHGVINL